MEGVKEEKKDGANIGQICIKIVRYGFVYYTRAHASAHIYSYIDTNMTVDIWSRNNVFISYGQMRERERDSNYCMYDMHICLPHLVIFFLYVVLSYKINLEIC